VIEKIMPMSLTLTEIETVAQNVHKESTRLLEESGDAAAPWKKPLKKVQETAAAVAGKAAEPVRLGIVGEFSAGKTLLPGALIGYADGLPISEDPTTGNVTSVNLFMVEEMAATRLENCRVSFLTHTEFENCLAFMLEQAADRAGKAELPADLRRDLQSIKV